MFNVVGFIAAVSSDICGSGFGNVHKFHKHMSGVFLWVGFLFPIEILVVFSIIQSFHTTSKSKFDVGRSHQSKISFTSR